MSLPLTRLALLGTISDLHQEPVAYVLDRLSGIVAELAPDLLCAEITREMWEGGDLSAASLEVRQSLGPVVAATDIVLVPVAPSRERFSDFAPQSGWQAGAVHTFDRLLSWGQRRAATPEAINSSLFGAFCHTVCYLNERSWTAEQRSAWNAQNEAIAANIVEAVRRDPGRRVLVAVQCQRTHKLEALLDQYPAEVRLVNYQSL